MPARDSRQGGQAAPALIEFGGVGDLLLFLHANGYPPASYKPLLGQLSADYHVLAMPLRPLWPNSRPADVSSWKAFSDDLLRLMIDQRLPPVIAMGHSVGAITALRAAIEAPDRFAALILLEPVLVPPHTMLAYGLVKLSGLGRRLHPMIRAANSRTRKFDSLEEAFERYRSRRIFHHLPDAALRALIEGLLKPDDQGGYVLAYSPEWESRVYYTAVWNDWDLWQGLPRLRIPTLIIRGSESDTFRESTARRVQELNPTIVMRTVDQSTHLLPLEQPQSVVELMGEFTHREYPEAAQRRVFIERTHVA